MSDGQEFLKECKEVRNDFVKIAGQYSVGEHLKLRTKIDTLLIMYDQLCERVRLADSSYENSGLHKHFVKRSTSAFMLISKTKPKVINAQIPIYWRKYVAEQDADLFGGKVVKCNITW